MGSDRIDVSERGCVFRALDSVLEFCVDHFVYLPT